MRPTGSDWLTRCQAPSAVLITAKQGAAEEPVEKQFGFEGGHEQRLYQVDLCVQGEARLRGSSGFSPPVISRRVLAWAKRATTL